MNGSPSLESLFEQVISPKREDGLVFSVLQLPSHDSFFIGKDTNGYACFLAATDSSGPTHESPIRLETLDVQFDIPCRLRVPEADDRQGQFSVVRCLDSHHETVRYFLSVITSTIDFLGEHPSATDLAAAIHRLAAIFEKLRRLPSRSVSGLFGELFLISQSVSAARSVEAWRADDNARFDFSIGDARVDAKCTTRRSRSHNFSFDQCNPPPIVTAVVASMFVEQISSGLSLRDLISQIEIKLGPRTDLILKLNDVIATTLGVNLTRSLSVCFDTALTESSLAFYDLKNVPAIRGTLPSGVSDVHFQSDLSNLQPWQVAEVVKSCPDIIDILPEV